MDGGRYRLELMLERCFLRETGLGWADLMGFRKLRISGTNRIKEISTEYVSIQCVSSDRCSEQ